MYPILTNREEATKCRLLVSGQYFYCPEKNINLYLPYQFDYRIDLENLRYATNYDDDLKEYPTLNELIKAGRIEQKSIYREYDVILPEYADCSGSRAGYPVLPETKIQAILKEFAENGFAVSKKAIVHNFCCWVADMKSGFRDEKGGYHLFSPCGCNMLSFRATTLHPELDDWQITYYG